MYMQVLYTSHLKKNIFKVTHNYLALVIINFLLNHDS
jgi:hypothetical protein